MKENWKSVDGFEGLYEVSDKGRVRSLDRVVVMSNGYERPLSGRLLKNWMTTGGYEQVSLRREGKTWPIGVHRLVCRAFNGPSPEGKTWVLHGDENKTNNVPSNLRWGTPKENTADTRRAGTLRNGNKGVTHCKHGHSLDQENTYVRPNGNRTCKTCRRRLVSESRARNLEAHAERDRERYRERKPLAENDGRHGTPSGYNNWKCRCFKCKDAHREYRKNLRLDNEAQAE